MNTLKVGGVPEHFNLPWHLCIEDGDFETAGVKVEWQDFPAGTGAMNSALRAGEIDVAVILTEGVVKDIIAGNPSRIVQTYVSSPLVWGIHVAADSGYNSVEELENTTAAISRKGSGSHLMTYVNARSYNWDLSELRFRSVENLEGAVKALTEDEAQYFLWEHFTTKPLVDNGIFRRVGDCPTPWPCFVIAVRQEMLKDHPRRIKRMLEVLDARTINFKKMPGITDTIASRYGQMSGDVEKWLKMTTWSQQQISAEELENVQQTLFELDLIPKMLPAQQLMHKF